MIVKKGVYIFVLALFFGVVPSLFAQKFKLDGQNAKIPNGDYVFLTQNNQKVDSALVSSGKFTFTTTGLQFPADVLLQYIEKSKGKAQFLSLVLEDTVMTLDAHNKTLNKAQVSGSLSQKKKEEKYSKIRKADSRILFKNAAVRRYIRKYPNNSESVEFLDFYKTTYGHKKTQSLYESLSPKNQSSQPGNEILKYLSISKPLGKGDLFLDFETLDLNGQQIKLSEVVNQNQLTLIDFWSFGCGPCIKQFPALAKIYKDYANQGFELLAVNMDHKDLIQDEKRRKNLNQLPWIQTNDGNMSRIPAMIYSVYVIPHNVLVDGDGKIIALNISPKQLKKKILKKIKKL